MSKFMIVDAKSSSGSEEGRMVSESRSLGLGKGGVVSDSGPPIAGGDSEAEGCASIGVFCDLFREAVFRAVAAAFDGTGVRMRALPTCTCPLTDLCDLGFLFLLRRCAITLGAAGQKKDTEKLASERQIDHLALSRRTRTGPL